VKNGEKAYRDTGKELGHEEVLARKILPSSGFSSLHLHKGAVRPANKAISNANGWF